MQLPLVLLLLAFSHQNSQSSSRLTVDGAAVQLELRCQALSLFEVLPGLDANGDELLVARELAPLRDAILEYACAHYVLRAGGERLVPEPGAVRLAAPDPRRIFPEPQQVDLALEYRAPSALEALEIEVTLFHDTSPDHRDFAQVLWNGSAPAGLILDRRRPRAVLPRAARAASGQGAGARALGSARFLRLGGEHILTGWDHLAFLLALLLAARSVRSLVGVVTAFTLAHSVTLALASHEWVRVPGGMVEITIALSIAYVGADNLLYPEPRTKWPEAFIFGLVHGLGFAGFLRESLLAAASRTWALVAFNLGVELGQLAVVLLAVALLHLARRGGQGRSAGLVPPRPKRWGSTLVLLLGLSWFVERAWL